MPQAPAVQAQKTELQKSLDKSLIEALKAGDGDVIQKLLQAGADANADVSGRPIIYHAAYSEDWSLIKILLTHGASPNVVDDDMSLLEFLVSCALPMPSDVVKCVLEKGANVLRVEKLMVCAAWMELFPVVAMVWERGFLASLPLDYKVQILEMVFRRATFSVHQSDTDDEHNRRFAVTIDKIAGQLVFRDKRFNKSIAHDAVYLSLDLTFEMDVPINMHWMCSECRKIKEYCPACSGVGPGSMFQKTYMAYKEIADDIIRQVPAFQDPPPVVPEPEAEQDAGEEGPPRKVARTS